MLPSQKQLILSPYLELYDILIPKDHFLRRLHDEVDLSFIYEELKSKYADTGRCAVDPVRLFKYLMLKKISQLSDVDLIEEVHVNMAYKFFLDMAPEELPIDPSTLCKFRRQRLKDTNLLDLLLGKTIQLALDRGILKRSREDGKIEIKAIIDATHTVSLHNLYRPVPVLKEYCKRLRREIYRHDESLSGTMKKDHEISNTDLKGELNYADTFVSETERQLSHLMEIQSFRRAFNRLKELVEDVKQHYYCSTDHDARLGHKSEDIKFFGYKEHIVMDSDSGLIVGAATTSGEVGDAIPGLEVIKKLAENPDLNVTEVVGDTAYSGQPFLDYAEQKGFDIVAAAHPNLGINIDGRDNFTFNKDADMFICPQGHLAISSSIRTNKKENNRRTRTFKFSREHCSNCPLKDTCLKKGNKSGYRSFTISLLSEEQMKLLERQNTEEFKDKRRKRYKIEQKNAHLKQSFGLGKAMGLGLRMMDVQASITYFVSNLKLIFSKS